MQKAGVLHAEKLELVTSPFCAVVERSRLGMLRILAKPKKRPVSATRSRSEGDSSDDDDDKETFTQTKLVEVLSKGNPQD